MVGKKDIEHIANLAHLQISASEAEKFTGEINNILEYVKKLNELDTEGVDPTVYIIPKKNVLREDKVEPSLNREIALSNAPEQKDGQFRVPKIMGD